MQDLRLKIMKKGKSGNDAMLDVQAQSYFLSWWSCREGSVHGGMDRTFFVFGRYFLVHFVFAWRRLRTLRCSSHKQCAIRARTTRHGRTVAYGGGKLAGRQREGAKVKDVTGITSVPSTLVVGGTDLHVSACKAATGLRQRLSTRETCAMKRRLQSDFIWMARRLRATYLQPIGLKHVNG